MQRIFVVLLSISLVTTVLRPSKAEMLSLINGSHLDGQLLNPDENPRNSYQFKLTNGTEVTLAPEQVREYKADRPEVAEYGRIHDKYPDTAEGQYKLALWCREHDLSAQKAKHLQRVIELDPDHADARRMLGYSKFDGQWMTIEEKKTKDGYVRDRKGDWKLPQEVALEEQRDRQQLAEREWFSKVKLWRGWLDTNRRKQGRDNLVNITDPRAVTALAKKLIGVERADLTTSQPPDPSVEARLIYIEALVHIATAATNPSDVQLARAALAMAALEDKDDEVWLSCMDELVKQKEDPLTVAFFIKQLRNKQNYIINRAAVGLGRMKDPTAISPLIDALITERKEIVGGNNPGQTTTTFGTRGTPGGGISMNQKPHVEIHYDRNQAVLDSLVAMTGQNFSYDKAAWRAWYVAQQSKGGGGLDVRRDK